MDPQSDPRVFFAAERTMLAWLRTGIASMGLGFLVARFGYFMAIVHQGSFKSTLASTLVGTGLVLVGTFMIVASTWQQARFSSTLSKPELPHRYSTRLGLILSGTMAVAGIFLACYLAFADSGFNHQPSPQAPTPSSQSTSASSQATF